VVERAEREVVVLVGVPLSSRKAGVSKTDLTSHFSVTVWSRGNLRHL
jgi:hypothetical protein